MGLFDGLEVRRTRNKLAVLEMKHAISVIEAISSPNVRGKAALDDPDAAGWTSLDKPSDDRSLDKTDQDTQRQQAIKFFYRNPHCRNIIRLIVKYVVGRGFAVVPRSPVPEVKIWWDRFWKLNRMTLRRREIVRRVMRDGETLLRFFFDKGNIVIRFMNPDLLAEPDDPKMVKMVKGNASHGIETAKDDIENVLAYWYNNERIPAEEVYHIKALVDSDVKRGRSYLEVIMPHVQMYSRWIKDRMKLNMVRAIVGLIRKVSGNPTQASNLAKQYETTKSRAPDNSPYHKMPEGVSIFTTNKGVDYDLKSPNLQAADVRHDGRAILLAIAAGVGMPEFMVTSDASNSNYASALVAEGPAVMEFEDWQDFFGFHFGEIFTKVIERGIKIGDIPEQAVVLDEVPGVDEDGRPTTELKKVLKPVDTEADVTFPDVAVNDILKETQAVVAQDNQGYISKRTARGKLGYDNEEEETQIAREDAMDDSEEEDQPGMEDLLDDADE